MGRAGPAPGRGFVHPASGAVEWFRGNRVDTALSAAVPARFAEAVGAGPGERVILVLDNAGWHGAGKLAVPEGARLVFQPPDTPELQPAEWLWPLARAAVANETSPARPTSTAPSPRAASPSPIGPTSSRPTPASTGGPRPHE